MVLPLASYFGVSADEILGFDTVKNEEKIKNYLHEIDRLAALGKVHEKFDLIVKAYDEFPNDWRIADRYIQALEFDQTVMNRTDRKFTKEELYKLCNRVLEECTLDETRYTALTTLGNLYYGMSS